MPASAGEFKIGTTESKGGLGLWLQGMPPVMPFHYSRSEMRYPSGKGRCMDLRPVRWGQRLGNRLSEVN